MGKDSQGLTVPNTIQDPCLDALAGAIHKEMVRIFPQGANVALADVRATLEKPKDDTMGDYALPVFRFAKALGAPPPKVAADLAAALSAGASVWIEKACAVGPFLNFFVASGHLATELLPRIQDGKYFAQARVPAHAAERVMIEYSQPNTHKVFHVGHMRNVALGDSLWRLYAYTGYPVTPVNYIGDEGTHIAKCLWYMKRAGAKAPATRKGEFLGEMYTKATFLLEDASEEERAAYEREVSAVLWEIESKSGPVYELWKETREWSLEDFREIYQWVGARFDHDFFESEVSSESQTIVDEYLKQGVFVEDQGAIGLDLKDDKLGFALLRKRDGNTLYATKDLALARHKFRDFNITKSIYVVGSEQNLHFRQVFKVLEKMGFPQAKNCFHLSYGLVVLPEGKMSSRRGNIIPFSKLTEAMGEELDKFLDKYRGEWPESEIVETRRRLAVGAIRYGMLFSDPTKEIVFDLKDWLSFEGNTGPYLMYGFARARSILRKAQEEGAAPSAEALAQLTTTEEHDLLLALYRFNEAVFLSCSQNKPSTLAHHLFDMCKAFNRFHRNVSVMKADTPSLRAARLMLVAGFASVLAKGLDLLGMTPPERM